MDCRSHGRDSGKCGSIGRSFQREPRDSGSLILRFQRYNTVISYKLVLSFSPSSDEFDGETRSKIQLLGLFIVMWVGLDLNLSSFLACNRCSLDPVPQRETSKVDLRAALGRQIRRRRRFCVEPTQGEPNACWIMLVLFF